MALDAQVDEYLNVLKTQVYRDGQEYKYGTEALKEMTFAAEALIKSRKIYYNRIKSFLNKRLVRLGLIQDKLVNLTEATQLQGKYDVFISNAKNLYDVSESMDQINANINVTVASFLKKINSYSREEEEVSKRIIIIDNILTYYTDAKADLEELREKISSLGQEA